MKVLLVKTSSLGDLIHCMPAVQELSIQRPDIELHWLVEEAFVDIPQWHPFVKKVHAYANRRWRKSKFSRQTRREVNDLKSQLRVENFDRVIDAQGLFKSALPTRWLKATTYGYDKLSIREPIATWFYDQKFNQDLQKPAIDRNRALFAWVFSYTSQEKVDFGLSIVQPQSTQQLSKPYSIFLHGTNWPSKVLPYLHWVELAQQMSQKQVSVYLPWSNDEERVRAEGIAENFETGVYVLDKTSLSHLAYYLQEAQSVIGCDTGLSHIAGACSTPTVAVYGASNSELTGIVGEHVKSLQVLKSCSPCMKSICSLTEDQTNIPCYADITPEQIEHELINLTGCLDD